MQPGEADNDQGRRCRPGRPRGLAEPHDGDRGNGRGSKAGPCGIGGRQRNAAEPEER